MIPGEYFLESEPIAINAGRDTLRLPVLKKTATPACERIGFKVARC